MPETMNACVLHAVGDLRHFCFQKAGNLIPPFTSYTEFIDRNHKFGGADPTLTEINHHKYSKA
jgi:hypothetical protein